MASQFVKSPLRELSRYIRGAAYAALALGAFAIPATAETLRPGEEIKVEQQFRRGDANSDGVSDISDAVFLLQGLFIGGEDPACLESADVNSDQEIDISDPVRLLQRLFLDDTPLPAPGLELGVSPAGTPLGCGRYWIPAEGNESTIEYRILDATTLEPISNTTVRLRRSSGSYAVEGKTDSAGLVEFLVPLTIQRSPVDWVLEAENRASGYAVLSGTHTMPSAGHWRITATTFKLGNLTAGMPVFVDELEAIVGNRQSTGFVLFPQYQIKKHEVRDKIDLARVPVCLGHGSGGRAIIEYRDLDFDRDIAEYVRIVRTDDVCPEHKAAVDSIIAEFNYYDSRHITDPDKKKFAIVWTHEPIIDGTPFTDYRGVEIKCGERWTGSSSVTPGGRDLGGTSIMHCEAFDYTTARKKNWLALYNGARSAAEEMAHPVYNTSVGVRPIHTDEHLIHTILGARSAIGLKDLTRRSYEENYHR